MCELAMTLKSKMGAKAATRLPTIAPALSAKTPPEVSPSSISNPQSSFLEVPSRKFPAPLSRLDGRIPGLKSKVMLKCLS